MTTVSPSATITAAPEAPAPKTWRVPCTFDGYVQLEAANRWEAQRKFEQMSLQQIAECLELWAGEPELKTKEAADV